eukprot:scaffold244189_cov36-Prasinocladus_malaysianus.AAC.2
MLHGACLYTAATPSKGSSHSVMASKPYIKDTGCHVSDARAHLGSISCAMTTTSGRRLLYPLHSRLSTSATFLSTTPRLESGSSRPIAFSALCASQGAALAKQIMKKCRSSNRHTHRVA